MAPLANGKNSVTIGKDGYNEWFKAGKDLILGFGKPSGDRAIVFLADGAPAYDSVMDTGEVYVPGGSLVELAGQPGDVLTVTARSATGK